MNLATRATCRGQVTRIVKDANEYLQQKARLTEKDAPLEEIEEDLIVFRDRLKAAHENLTRANNEVRASIKTEDFEKEAESVIEYEDKALSTISRLTQRLAKMHANQNRFNNNAVGENSANAQSNQEKSAAVKLPSLQLKKFSGDYRDWLPFWEQYKTAVHDNCSLKVIEKFNYLQSVLIGNAAETIAGLTPSEACYDSAISLLQEEYGNTDKIVDQMMQRLLSIQPVFSKTDASGLRRLYNSIMACTRSLSALGISSTSYYIMLKGVLLRNLPNDLRVDFHRHYGDISDHTSKISDKNAPDSVEVDNDAESVSSLATASASIIIGDKQVQCLLKFIKREVESLEKAYEAKPPKSSNLKSGEAKSLQNVSKNYKTAVGLFTAGTNMENICFFCKSAYHGSKECNSAIPLAKRKEMLKMEGRCFRCIKRGHSAKICRNRSLNCKKCNGRHVTSMCDPEYKRNAVNDKAKENPISTSAAPAAVSLHQQALNLCTSNTSMSVTAVFLQTACAFVFAPQSTNALYLRLIMDGGSQISFVKSSIARKLNLPVVGTHHLSVLPFGSSEYTPSQLCNRVRMKVQSQYADGKSVIIEAVEVPHICVDVLDVPNSANPLLDKFALADARICGVTPEDGISVLLGADCYWKFIAGENVRVTDNLMAVNTILGWTLHGPVPVCAAVDSSSLIEKTTALNVSLCEDLKRFWDLETIGITAENKSDSSCDFPSCIQYGNGRYVASLPWRKLSTELDSNRSGALLRFNSLVRRLLREKQRFIEYDSVMRDYIDSNCAEKVLNENEGQRIFYLPHRAVYRADKNTTKIRIVFDASAHASDSLSLNDHLEIGANLLPDILTILLNFRCDRFAVVADIQKAFLQVGLCERDRDSHRFFWFDRKLDESGPQPQMQIYRMTRVTFGVTCSPYLLGATIAQHLKIKAQQYPDTCKLLSRSFYMDDLLVSICSEQEGEKLYREAVEVMNGAAMTLCKWNSNSVNLRRHFNQQEEPPEIQKVLGVKWHVLSDELAVDLQPVKELLHSLSPSPTKRTVLKVISKIYDPIGFLGPCIIRCKILFQMIWRLKLNWDEFLIEDLRQIWASCCADINNLDEMAVPRSIVGQFPIIYSQIHIFADASMQAYGAVSYIRSVDSSGQILIRFLCAKNRVAPLKENGEKELTLPKLELTAALIACRLKDYLKENLKVTVTEEWLWTDSKIALYWILGDVKRWKPYIANRVREIQSKTLKNSWRHVPGNENPADLLTRGISANSLLNSQLWTCGPTWLQEDPAYWPKSELNENDSVFLASLIAEVKDADNVNTDLSKCDEPFFSPERFSTWRRLLRVTAYIYRFINLLKKRVSYEKFISAEEIIRAQDYWIAQVQRQQFYHEIVALRSGKSIPLNSKLLTLNPLLDSNGNLRVGGRLQLGLAGINAAHPLILPKSSYVTRLIVADAHEKTFHAGPSLVLTRLRSKFWIIRGRQLVRTVIKQCNVCKVLHAKPASEPFAPLPRDRMFLSRPFKVTGIDFAGPLYVTTAEERKKMYIMLFTCAAVRAVHLELTPDLSTESCLLGLRRFVARRGAPEIIYSDNAATFKRAALELRKLSNFISSEELGGFLSNQHIAWKFIVERAPWWGGFWERLVGVVKSALKVALRKSTLNADQLYTIITEVENVVNSRPLTYAGEDPLDLSPLTPAQFLHGSLSASTEPFTTIAPYGPNAKELQQQWKYRLKFLSSFRRRWYHEYLHQLRSLHHDKRPLSSNLKLGDVVLLQDPSLPRTLWHLAIIEQVFPGRDGKIRACQIRLNNGSKLKRPVQLLYPLELK